MADEHEAGPEPKRRKLRKGTQSCWECKRRKIRCTFVTPEDLNCDGCKQRGVRCISQEFPEEKKSSQQDELESRLARVEGYLERLSDFVPSNKSTKVTSESSGERCATKVPGQLAGTIDSRMRYSPTNRPQDTGGFSLYGIVHAQVCSALIGQWPNQRESQLIMSLPAGQSDPDDGSKSRSLLNRDIQTTSSPHEILQLPSLESNAHPALIACRLLRLASFIQEILPRPGSQASVGLNTPIHVMYRLVNIVNQMVTSNDDLINSIEGVECIMLESNIHNNLGSLRRAWALTRRAMTVAQAIGLHRICSSSDLHVLTAETRAIVNTEYMWFRIVQSDRYLSMMLDLPQGSLDERLASHESLEACTPVERFQRLDCAAAGRLLQRHDTTSPNPAVTKSVDDIMKRAAACMPTYWWLLPSIAPLDDEGFGVTNQYMRYMDHFMHFYLLVQLHLPHVVDASSSHQNTNSKIIAINASREILVRFVSFRHSYPQNRHYCRGVDFLAFVASCVLLFTHIVRHRLHKSDLSSGEENPLEFLGHQLLSDRGLLEQTVKLLGDMSLNGIDRIAAKATDTIGVLLAMELEAEVKAKYTTHTSTVDGRDSPKSNTNKDESARMSPIEIYIPYSGTIRIERNAVSKAPIGRLGTPTTTSIGFGIHKEHTLTAPADPDPSSNPPDPNPDDSDDEWDLQGVDWALIDTMNRASGLDSNMAS